MKFSRAFNRQSALLQGNKLPVRVTQETSVVLASSGFGPTHVIPVVFATLDESQTIEIPQPNYRLGSNERGSIPRRSLEWQLSAFAVQDLPVSSRPSSRRSATPVG